MFPKSMKKLAGSFAAAATIMLGMIPTATADPCGQRADLAQFLEQRYGETIRATGITGRGALIEIYASEKGTWTMVLTLPSGPSCVLGDGTDWEMKITSSAQES